MVSLENVKIKAALQAVRNVDNLPMPRVQLSSSALDNKPQEGNKSVTDILEWLSSIFGFQVFLHTFNLAFCVDDAVSVSASAASVIITHVGAPARMHACIILSPSLLRKSLKECYISSLGNLIILILPYYPTFPYFCTLSFLKCQITLFPHFILSL